MGSDNSDSPADNKTLLMRVWGMLPAIMAAVLILLIIALGAGVSSKKKRLIAEKMAAVQNKRPPVNVIVLEARPKPIKDVLDLPGETDPWVSLDIKSEAIGKVISVGVREGQKVKKGDTLAVLDSSDYQNSVQSAKASYELAQSSHLRMKNLHGQQLASKADLDTAAAQAEVSFAAMKSAELMLEKTIIKAPMDGMIEMLDAKVGLLINPADKIATLIDISKVKVNVGIPESDVDSVRRLVDFEMKFDALSGRMASGRKYFLSSSPETFARLYKLQIEVQNEDGAILPGMFCRVKIVKHLVNDAISVPLYSVIDRGGEKFVYVESGGMAETRHVATGILEGWLVEITKGLKSGDRVVVVGQRSIEQGQELSVSRAVTDPAELFK